MTFKTPKSAIMGHLVLGYPTLAVSLATARQYVAAGIDILELQIPFSHPTADGPAITAACQVAVEQQKVTVDDCLGAIATLREEFPRQEIMVMSYVNRVFAYGLERFVAAMRTLEVRQLIIPDLPVDSGLARQLTTSGDSAVRLVPVLAANVTDERLGKLLAPDAGFDFFYLMSDFKITGSAFSLHPRLVSVIERIRAADASHRVGIGFGIGTAAQVAAVLEVADVAIVGSALIGAQQRGELDLVLDELLRDV
jgi:tryptophan synthase alpha chain